MEAPKKTATVCSTALRASTTSAIGARPLRLNPTKRWGAGGEAKPGRLTILGPPPSNTPSNRAPDTCLDCTVGDRAVDSGLFEPSARRGLPEERFVRPATAAG